MDQDWVDFTDDIKAASKGLKLFELITYDGFVLEDSMQANEVNDSRVDSKALLSDKCHLRNLVKEGHVREASSLAKYEITQLYDDVLSYEMQALANQPIAVSVYQLPYLYDRQMCKENPFVHVLVESVITMGAYCLEVIRNGCSVRDDDINFSQLSFPADRKTHEEIVEMLLKIEKSLPTKKGTPKEELELNEALLIRLKFRRFWHLMSKSLGTMVQAKQIDKILKDIESCSKRLEEWKAVGGLTNKPLSNIFNQELFRTLRAHISPRKPIPLDHSATIPAFQNMLQQLKLMLNLPDSYLLICQKIDKLRCLPLNTVSKSYILSNLFSEQGRIMQIVSMRLAVANDISEWSFLKESIAKGQLLQKWLNQISPFMLEMLIKLSLNRPKCFVQLSKSYDNINYVVYRANELDAMLSEGRKELLVCSWVYSIGLDVMARQLYLGLETELFYAIEYPYIFYNMEYIYNIFQKNASIFLKKFDKGYIEAFNNKSLDHKKKKKISQTYRRMFSTVVFNRGLLFYYRALYIMLLVFAKAGALKGALEKGQKERYTGRFKFFKKIQFTRIPDYETFYKEYEKVTEQSATQLSQAEKYLKEAKNVFQSMAVFDESDCNPWILSAADHLTKSCVRMSLQTMRFKGNNQLAKNMKFLTSNPCFPEFTF